MSTNFYARRIPSQEEWEKAHQNLDEVKKGNKSYTEFEEYLDELFKEIHIGKRCAGWQFLWEFHDGKYYEDNLESIKKFLYRPDIQIYDEYEKEFTPEQFFKNEVNNILYTTKDLFNAESYYSKHPDERMYYDDAYPQEWTSKDGLRFWNVNFS